MTVVSAKSFPDGASLPLVADIQYREPYSSAAFNRKLRGILGMGLYKGLYPMPGSGLNLLISSQDSGDTSGTASFDIGDDYQITVRQQADITIAMTAGTSKIVALQCVFGLGIETYQVNSDSTVQAAEIVLLDAGTTLGSNQLELGVVTIPADATQITTDMIDVSGRILQTIGIELSSALDGTSETVAANSYAIKRALDYVAGKFALLGSNADITSMSALTGITSSALSIAGALTLSSTLNVAGAAAFSSDVTTGGKLTAAGETSLISTLNVTGATTLSSTLGVAGTTTLSGALIAGSTLALTGAAALSSSLIVAGASTLVGAVIVGSTFEVAGTATFDTDVVVNGILTGTTQSVGTKDTSMATTAFVVNAIGSLKGVARFTASGTFTVPDGVTTVYISGCGGGGGGAGGGCRTTTSEFGGGGGGGGAGFPVIKMPVTVTPGETIPVTIGAGGEAGSTAVGANGTYGGAGGATSFGSYLTLAAGSGAVAGGGASAQFGGWGGDGYPAGGSGNDGAGAGGIGTGGGGAGASGPFGGGGAAVRSSSGGSAAGNPGYAAYGYGAGGGGGSTGVNGVGKPGMPGLIIVEW